MPNEYNNFTYMELLEIMVEAANNILNKRPNQTYNYNCVDCNVPEGAEHKPECNVMKFKKALERINEIKRKYGD